MPSSYESYHLLRVMASPKDVAAQFINYTRAHHIKTRALCRIGYVSRAGAKGGASTSAPSLTLRGLIANKDIPKDENVVMMPVSACVHPGTALACKAFMDLIPLSAQNEYFNTRDFLENTRVTERSLIRHNQFLLAMYLTFLIMSRAFRVGTLESLPGSDVLAYLDFLPRGEGNFEVLSEHLHGWLNTAEVCRVGQQELAQHFGVTQAEVRPVLVFTLCMIYSRMVPIDHRDLLKYAFKGTPVGGFVQGLPNAAVGLPESTGPSSSESSRALQAQQHAAAGSNVRQPSADQMVRDPISFLCPIIDMCNHSESENVAVMVPDNKPSALGPIICLRSLRDIAKGEELTMTYGGQEAELKLIWGMDPILV